MNTIKSISKDRNQIAKFIKSKRLSDELIDLDMRSMRLTLEAYNVPETLMPQRVSDFELIADDESLSKEDKIQLSQKLLFSQDHFNKKQKF